MLEIFEFPIIIITYEYDFVMYSFIFFQYICYQRITSSCSARHKLPAFEVVTN